MKRLCLVVIGLYVNFLAAFGQVADSLAYKKRTLSLDEINIVSSYYRQDGNNSAVTGGIGTEKLQDFSNGFEVKLLKYNKQQKKVSWDATLGIDYYTSASSDKIDPYTISSASHEDLRIYPSVTRSVMNETTGAGWNAGLSYSHESDYESFGFGAGIEKKSKDKNTTLSIKMQVYLDQLAVILPVELRTPATGGLPGAPNQYDYPHKKRDSYLSSIALSRVLNKRLQVMAMLDLSFQQGFLGLPFHRIYFWDDVLGTEKLPSTRFKIPIALRGNYFLGNRVILRGMYRFYKDDWGLDAHTADLETVVKITPFFSLSPFYRFYTQSAIDFFAGYGKHREPEQFYSSNYDLSKFYSHFVGGNLHWAPAKGLLGMKHWNMIELRYGHYSRSNGLKADIFSLHLKYK